ncbi:hypothetical protein Q3G72_000985 [Acer saccharum]|nr:hypothetical protein Q3G72_000985 [Acer saccharum]
MIIGIPISKSVCTDTIVWHFDKSGEYSVKTGYMAAMLPSQLTSSSEPSGNNNLWKLIWRLLIPGKIKNFLWRACQHFLPSLVNLDKMGIHVDGLCPRCLRKPETICYALWGCPVLKVVRRFGKALSKLHCEDKFKFQDFFYSCIFLLKDEELALLGVQEGKRSSQRISRAWPDDGGKVESS